MSTLFLDDSAARLAWAWTHLQQDGLTVTVSADGAIESMREQEFDTVYLDHDLGGTTYQDRSEDNSGSGVVRWILAHRPSVGRFVVHSMNTVEANRMVQDLRRAGYPATYVPFSTLVGNYGRA